MTHEAADSPSKEAYLQLIRLASQALRSGDRLIARRYAEQALAIDPEKEEPWLILAATAGPRASIYYLNQALRINPHSKAARQGMHWAVQRLRNNQPEIVAIPRSIQVNPIASDALVRPKQVLFPYIFILLLVVTGFGMWYRFPNKSLASVQEQSQPVALATAAILVSETLSLPATQVASPTPSLEPTQTQYITETPVQVQSQIEVTAPLATATETPIPDAPVIIETPTATVAPTEVVAEQPKKKKKKANKNAQANRTSLSEVQASGERWIDVDLSDQLTYAYEGNQMVRSFLVSTGTWQYPTVTGQYRVYVKYRAADMSGPGYYLPDVPYVMYFYKGYGLHGTYWHNNFGTPMSHGCVNLSPDDAGWLFDFASIGTIVNVHQ